VAPFADLRDLGALLQRAGFALPVADVDRLTVRYATPIRPDARPAPHGRRQSTRRSTPPAAAPRDAAALAGDLCERFADADGRVRATFEVVWLSGWAPHASQQKPLAPGSARARLADALGTREVPAGEKAGR
jgi:hypothetical protein